MALASLSVANGSLQVQCATILVPVTFILDANMHVMYHISICCVKFCVNVYRRMARHFRDSQNTQD
jgi:hypothetical protein